MANSQCKYRINKLGRKSVSRIELLCLIFTVLGANFIAKAFADDFQDKNTTASFVFNFTKFVEWPDLAPESPITLCVHAESEMNGIFQRYSGRVVAGHPLKIMTYSPERLKNCQVLFLDWTHQQVAACNSAQQFPQLLIVSNIPDFVSECGLIGLFKDNGQLRFEINLDAVNRSELKMSSHLLRLARIRLE